MFTNDPIQIGIIALPNGIAQVIFGGCATIVMGKVGHLKLQVIFFLVVQTVFVAAYAGVVPGNRTGWTAFQFFGMGPFALITLLCYVIAGLNVPLRHLGLASGLIGTFRSAGGSVGNAGKRRSSNFSFAETILTVMTLSLQHDLEWSCEGSNPEETRNCCCRE
jgi:hypothetical protein